METESRIKKVILNARVNLLFYFIGIIISFFSRRIFLEELGDDFVGLTGVLMNILGFLNLAELGVSAAIGYLLYEPLQKKQNDNIEDLVNVFGYLYRKIGYIILVLGIVISFFLPYFFRETSIDIKIVYFAYYSFLSSSLISYFCNYKQTLLVADQKNYIVASYYQSGIVVKVLFQIGVVLLYSNYYYWIFIELFYGIIYSFILNWKIRQVYPWLNFDVKLGKNMLAEHRKVFRYVKLIFVHKMKDFLLTQSDQIFVFAFVSLKMVAYYGNYVLIISKIGQLSSAVLDSVVAGIGNLVAEGDKGKIVKVFWELMAIRYYFAGVLSASLYLLMSPFIKFWLGPDYVLSNLVLSLFIINVFIMQSRGAVDSFNAAFGLYNDTWSAWTEGGINIGITIILGFYWGIVGILLGKIISVFLIVVLWKPYYLFQKGFELPIALFWKNTLRYYIVLIFSFSFLFVYATFFEIMNVEGIRGIIKIFLLGVLPFSFTSFLLFYFFTPGLNTFFARFLKRCS